MHLFMAREAVDKHLQVAGAMIDPEKAMGEKLQKLPSIFAFYASWYPTRWLPRATYSEFGRFASHLRFVERNCRRLARQVFHGMMWHQAALQRKQMFLFRLVDVANELFAMAATITRTHAMLREGHPEAENAAELCELFCRSARRKVRRLFHELWFNDDDFKYKVASGVLKGKQLWLEELLRGLDKEFQAPPPQRAAAPVPEKKAERPQPVAVH
jgi:hypothetical protein